MWRKGKKSERWWKNRGSGRKKKKNTKRERMRGEKSGKERERSSMSNSALDQTAHHPFPSSSIEDTLRLSVPLYVLALAHRSSLHSRTYTYPHIQARTESRSHPPAARSPASSHPVSSTLARPACSRPLRVSAARSNHPVPRRVPQGMSLYTAGMQLSALSPLDPFSRRVRSVYKKNVSLIRRDLSQGVATLNSNTSG